MGVATVVWVYTWKAVIIFWKGMALIITASTIFVIVSGMLISFAMYLKRKEMWEALQRLEADANNIQRRHARGQVVLMSEADYCHV